MNNPRPSVIVTTIVLSLSACGGTVDDKGASDNSAPTNAASNSTSNASTQNADPVQRDVRTECTNQLLRLNGCGQATDEEVDLLQSMLCNSSDFSDGQVATVVSCLGQWQCGAAPPACLQDPDPEPECIGDADCAAGRSCSNGVCQSAPDLPQCTTLSYSAGTVGDGTKQLRTGEECSLPGECLSERCVSSSGSDTSLEFGESWCGNKGDCRNPNNADEECPDGWACEEVLRSTFDDNPRWLCIKPNITEVCR